MRPSPYTTPLTSTLLRPNYPYVALIKEEPGEE